jgi:hypothetical protein
MEVCRISEHKTHTHMNIYTIEYTLTLLYGRNSSHE